MKMPSNIENALMSDLDKFIEFHGGFKELSEIYKKDNLTYRRMMWDCFSSTRKDRAYDDGHPRYQWVTRVLPFDGTDYCFWYNIGLGDHQIETMMKKYLKSKGYIKNASDFTLPV